MKTTYATLLNETKNSRNEKTSQVCELQNNIVKMLILPQMIYRFKIIHLKTHEQHTFVSLSAKLRKNRLKYPVMSGYYQAYFLISKSDGAMELSHCTCVFYLFIFLVQTE